MSRLKQLTLYTFSIGYFPTAMAVYLLQSAYLGLTSLVSLVDCIEHTAYTIVHTHATLISSEVPHHRAAL